jgi:hypothetical protein
MNDSTKPQRIGLCGIINKVMSAIPTIEKYLKKHPAAAEYRFLFECCRAAFAGTMARYPDGIRPKVFLEIVQHHKLVPHLYPILKSHCENVPSVVLSQFQQLVKRHNLHILKLSGELARLSRLFAANDIPWLSIKGPALSVQLYGDIAMRQSGDLDILVDEGNLERVKHLLKDAGYHSLYKDRIFNRKQRTYYQKYVTDQSWRNSERNIHIELHWRLTQSDRVAPNNADWFQHKTDVTIGNSAIPTLDRLMHTLYLCRHGSLHLWFRLFWLWDVAYIFQQITEDESRALRKLVQQYRLEKILDQSIYFSQQIFRISLPHTFPQNVCLNKIIDPVLCHILENKSDQRISSMWHEYIYRMRLQSGIRYWWAVSALMVNNPRDWETICLPESLFFLYYIIKPAALVKRKLRR